MKKVVLLIVLGFLISSCSEDDEVQIAAEDLIGTWSCTAIDYTGTTKTEIQGQTITASFDGVGYDIDFTFTLSENPNIASSEGQYSIELTSMLLGQNSVQNIEGLAFSTVGFWTRDGVNMTISQDGKTSNVTIVKLTKTVLELKISNEETISQSGTNVNAMVDSNVRFVRD